MVLIQSWNKIAVFVNLVKRFSKWSFKFFSGRICLSYSSFFFIRSSGNPRKLILSPASYFSKDWIPRTVTLWFFESSVINGIIGMLWPDAIPAQTKTYIL